MLNIIPLTSQAQFIELTNQFDKEHNTQTYVTKLDLYTINDVFFGRNPYYSLEQIVLHTFKDSNVIYSDDSDIDKDDRSKLYSFYHIVKDIQNGVGLLHPVNIHYFGFGQIAIHPGNTRLFFMHQYPNPVDVIITDYANIITDIPQLELHKVEDYKLDLHDLSFLTNIASTSPRSIRNAAGRDVHYKECKHVPSANEWGLDRNNEPVLQYELYGDCVYVNGHKIMYKNATNWQFDI